MTKAGALGGNVAIITGGASGIGRALGEELASRGCEVVLADRQVDVAAEAASAISARGGRAFAEPIDVRERASFDHLVETTVSRSGRIDFFFNNAGIAVGGELASYDVEDYDDVIDVNLRGVAYGIHAVYPIMIEQRSGHIVNTASMAGLVTTAATGSYAATKHAVVGLTKALRVEARRYGVRASVLCPGAIKTPILTGGRFGRTRVTGLDEAAQLKLWERARPMPVAVFAEKAIDAIVRDDAIIVLPRWWKVLWYIDRISPSLSMALTQRLHTQLLADIAAAGGSYARPAKRPARVVS